MVSVQNPTNAEADAADGAVADEDADSASETGEQDNAEAKNAPGSEPANPARSLVLPWNRSSQDAPKPPQKRKSSAREMLGLYGIDQSQIEQLQDGREIVSDEIETLYKILYRLPYLRADRLELWARDDVSWPQLVADPEAYRLDVFPVRGRARAIQQLSLPPEAAERFGFDRFYSVEIEREQDRAPVLLWTRNVPQSWSEEGQLNERVAFVGLLLKSGGATDGTPPMVFAAERLAWLPDRVDPPRGISRSLVLLGDLQVDVGLLENLRQTNRQGLTPQDREPFYQFLAAMERSSFEELWPQARRDVELANLLTRPESFQGELIQLEGTVRRIQKIMVGEEEIQQRFGLDHYYELDVFLPLGDQEVRLGSSSDGDEAPVFRNSFPVTCCVRSLPAGLSEGANLHEQVRIAGFFFKIWAYRTEFVSRFGKGRLQIGPMIIAPSPELAPEETTAHSAWEWWAGIGFVAAICGLAIGLWLFRRSDRRFERETLRPQFDIEPEQSLDKLGIEAQQGPNFDDLK